MSGTVYLVGAGPGAPDLLTLRAARLLAAADIVFHDALVRPETLALAVRAEKVAVGKRDGRVSVSQAFISRRLVTAARRHAMVVRLKGGDPMLFGRAQEEIDALEAAGIAVEVVPGVTAALAAAAELRVPLTRRGVARSVAFVTPRAGRGETEGNWQAVAAAADTVAFYMGAGEAQRITDALIAAGRPGATRVAFVESASLPGARHARTTLRDLPLVAATRGDGPAMVLVLGETRARRRTPVPHASAAAQGVA